MKAVFDMRLAFLTIVLLFALVPVFSFVHEYGHAGYCVSQDRNYVVGIIGFQAYTSCEGKFDDPTSYRMAGGFLASGIALISFALLRKHLVGNLKFIAITLVSIGVMEYSQMITEGFFNDFHMGGSAIALNWIILLVVPIILIHRASKTKLEIRP